MNGPIFVFGSNLAGRHGKGAALFARQNYNAEYGVGEGPTGCAYALPTKDESLNTLPLSQIEKAIERFVDHARRNRETVFHMTPVGTGLAGYSKKQVWRIIARIGLPSNVLLTSSWITDKQ